MVCLQQPANLVPHVIQAGVRHSAGGNDLIAVQPRIVLQYEEHQALCTVSVSKGAPQSKSLFLHGTPEPPFSGCLLVKVVVCWCTLPGGIKGILFQSQHSIAPDSQTLVLHCPVLIAGRTCLLTMDMKL